MPHEIAITYAIAELFCTIMLGLLLSSSLHVKMFSSRQQWFNVILVLQILYLFGNSFRSLVQGGVVSQSVLLLALVFLYLCLFMNVVSYVTFMYVMTSMELAFFQTKRGRLLSPPLLYSLFGIGLVIFGIFSSNAKAKENR